jgi:hypothetical protein
MTAQGSKALYIIHNSDNEHKYRFGTHTGVKERLISRFKSYMPNPGLILFLEHISAKEIENSVFSELKNGGFVKTGAKRTNFINMPIHQLINIVFTSIINNNQPTEQKSDPEYDQESDPESDQESADLLANILNFPNNELIVEPEPPAKKKPATPKKKPPTDNDSESMPKKSVNKPKNKPKKKSTVSKKPDDKIIDSPTDDPELYSAI